MDPRLDDYDWEAAFAEPNEEYGGIAGGRGSPNQLKPTLGYTGSVEPITRADVAEVIALSVGEHDERDWLCACRTTDGRFVLVRAGCDYTGWDCQSGGAFEFAASLPDLIRWGMSPEERTRLGLCVVSSVGS